MATDLTGQILLMGVPGKELDAETARELKSLQPGGFILFGRNIESPAQLRKLIDDLRDLSDVEPVITIDQEGGRVSRLRLLGNEPPNAQQLRDKNDQELIRRHGELTAGLLRLFGFNLDLCPVLDISFDDDADNSLRGRCYGRTADEVIEKAGIFNDALRTGGILSCGKHFPGYTCAPFDPHHELPTIERSLETLEEHELKVFRAMTDRIDSMMIGHALYPALGVTDRPASVSRKVVQELLREEMGFDGLIMTDDLDMGAILNHLGFTETMQLGLEAGNDFLMICHRVTMARDAVEAVRSMDQTVVDQAIERVVEFKKRLHPPHDFSEEAFRALDDQVWDLRVATLGEEKAREKSPEDGKRSPVELY